MGKLCLENWWIALPELRGRRYYSVQLGGQSTRNGANENTSMTIDIRCYPRVHRDGEFIRATWLRLNSVALLQRCVARLASDTVLGRMVSVGVSELRHIQGVPPGFNESAQYMDFPCAQNSYS